MKNIDKARNELEQLKIDRDTTIKICSGFIGNIIENKDYESAETLNDELVVIRRKILKIETNYPSLKEVNSYADFTTRKGALHILQQENEQFREYLREYK